MARKAWITAGEISLMGTTVRRSRPTSVMGRPSAAYTLDAWAGSYSPSASSEGQALFRHTVGFATDRHFFRVFSSF